MRRVTSKIQGIQTISEVHSRRDAAVWGLLLPRLAVFSVSKGKQIECYLQVRPGLYLFISFTYFRYSVFQYVFLPAIFPFQIMALSVMRTQEIGGTFCDFLVVTKLVPGKAALKCCAVAISVWQPKLSKVPLGHQLAGHR